MAITRPVMKVTGFAAGLAFGISDFKAHRDFGAAVRARQGSRAAPREPTSKKSCAAPARTYEPTRSRSRSRATATSTRSRTSSLGGLAVRLDLTVDLLDDLQVALDTVLQQQEADGELTIAVRVRRRRARTR